MDKTAQKRYLSKLREMTNVSGRAAETFFNPQFKEVMENLRQIDDNVRSIAAGQPLDQGDPGKDPISLKKLIQSAKTNLNRREFMKAVSDLSRFHKHLLDIQGELGKLHNKVDEVHHQFLFQDLDPEHMEQLQSLKSRWAARTDSLRKEASIADFLHNIVSERGRALAFYEKRYPKQVGKLKKDTTVLLSRAEAVLTQVLVALKEMAHARAVRNVDAYMKSAGKIEKAYAGYSDMFRNYYTENVKGFLDKVKMPSEKVDEKEVGKQEVQVPEKKEEAPEAAPESESPFGLVTKKPYESTPQVVVTPPSMSGPPSAVGPTQYGPPGASPPFATPITPVIPGPPKLPTGVGEIPEHTTIPVGAPEKMEERPATILPPPVAHQQFVASLEALSGESPVLLASVIKRYAKSIQAKEPQTAQKLAKIASRIGS